MADRDDMKFFHISDLHIGLKLLDHDLTADQRHVFGQIVEHARAERPDAIVIAGDIYNKAAPSPEAVALYDWFMEELAGAVPDAAIMVIAGNHDEALRIDMYSGILDAHGIHLVGTPPKHAGDHIRKVALRDEHGEVLFWLLPFLTPARIHGVFEGGEEDGAACDGAAAGDSEYADDEAGASVEVPDADSMAFESDNSQKQRRTYDEAIRALLAREDMDLSVRNVMVSHQFYVPAGIDPDDIEHMDSENLRVGGLGAVGADVLQAFDYAALGHLHKPMRVGSENIRYCGTPMQYSVSEAGQEKGIIVVDMGAKGDVSTRVIPLEPLHQIKKVEGSLDAVLDAACDDYVSVTLEDMQDVPALEARDRIKAAFPNLLTYSCVSGDTDLADLEQGEQLDLVTPFDMCLRFLGDATDEQKAMLREVIDEAVQAENEAD